MFPTRALRASEIHSWVSMWPNQNSPQDRSRRPKGKLLSPTGLKSGQCCWRPSCHLTQEYHQPEDGANTDEDRAERQREAPTCHLDTWMQPRLKPPYPPPCSV